MKFSNEKYPRRKKNQDRKRSVLKVVNDDKIPLIKKKKVYRKVKHTIIRNN